MYSPKKVHCCWFRGNNQAPLLCRHVCISSILLCKRWSEECLLQLNSNLCSNCIAYKSIWSLKFCYFSFELEIKNINDIYAIVKKSVLCYIYLVQCITIKILMFMYSHNLMSSVNHGVFSFLSKKRKKKNDSL